MGFWLSTNVHTIFCKFPDRFLQFVIFCNLISNLRILLQITKFCLQIQLNPSKKLHYFCLFLDRFRPNNTQKPLKFSRASRAGFFRYFYKLSHEFLQIVAWFSTNCTFLQNFCRSQNPSTNFTFLSANVVF